MSSVRPHRRNIRPRHVLALLSLLALTMALATSASAQISHSARSQAGRPATSAAPPNVHYFGKGAWRIHYDPSLAAFLPKPGLRRGVKVIRQHGGAASAGRSVGPDSVSTSSNWSGYADVACSTCGIRYVQANFNPQEINCSGVTGNGTHEVGEWAGLNGDTDTSAQQIGWASYCDGTAVHSFLWYENLPDAYVTFTITGWHTGDEYTAEAYYQASTNTYFLTLEDDSLNAGFTVGNLSCAQPGQCKNNSAEVIAEAPNGGPPGTLLANFGQFVPFEATVTSLNGTHGNMGSGPLWNSQENIMEYPGSTVMAEPGSLVNSGNDSEFTDTWHSAG
jgi:hypothetical protein